MPSVLNVGGGSKAVAIPSHYNDWDHLLLDIDPKRGVDVVCDARMLASRFASATYDAVYCSHNLEHYYRHDVLKVLGGFLHVLKDEGFAEIRVPDIGELIRLMASADLDIENEIYKASVGAISAHDMIYGYGPEIEESGEDFYAHKTGFSRASLARVLVSSGFSDVYFAEPMAMLELRAFAFKNPAGEIEKARLSLSDKYFSPPATTPEPRQSIAQTDRADDSKRALDDLYMRAVAAWEAEKWRDALALAAEALQIDNALPALHYLAGCCSLELKDWQLAADTFQTCISLGPAYPLDQQARVRRALCLARGNLRAGKRPAERTLADGDKRTVSVIMCSASRPRFDKTSAMYRQLLAGLPHEIIGIHDARSLAEGYNRGLGMAANELVLFAHDDVEIVSTDFAARLLEGLRRHDLVGMAGTRKLKGGAWHFAGHPNLQGQIGMPSGKGLVVTVYGVATPSSGRLQALDGLLLATRRDIARQIGFDAQTFDGWHLYDLDFTLRAARAGLDCATCNDILVVHGSQGSYNQDWMKYSERFLSKHALERGESVFYSPELVSIEVDSADEWRMLTEQLLDPAATGGGK